jgi:hypothetical protein
MNGFRYQRTAPLLPEAADLANPARRMNRFGIAVAVCAGLGAVALAVLVSPIAVPSATMASYSADGGLSALTAATESGPSASVASRAADSAMAASEIRGKGDLREQPASVAAERQFQVVLAALPQRAAKSDNLSHWTPPEPESRAPVADSWFDPDSLSRPDGADAADSSTVSASQMPETESRTASSSEAEPEAEGDAEGDAEPLATPKPKPEVKPVATATRTAPVKSDVNMRARPDNKAAVILVVPGKSEVEVIGCRYWCEVIFRGKRGWIYKGFVRGA